MEQILFLFKNLKDPMKAHSRVLVDDDDLNWTQFTIFSVRLNIFHVIIIKFMLIVKVVFV